MSNMRGILMVGGAALAVLAAINVVHFKHAFWIGAGVFAIGAVIPDTTSQSSNA